MEYTVSEQTVEITNKLGIHARPAALFVKLAGRFKSDISVSEAPVIHSEDSLPEFMSFDTRPGRIAAIIGLIIIAIGVVTFSVLGMQDIGAIIVFVGVAVLFSGLFYLSRRKTPS